MTDDPLREALIALAAKLTPHDIPLIIGGGYGLVLRGISIARELRANRYGLMARFRSTQDIDCVLGMDIITDAGKMQRIREALTVMGYASVEAHWAFAKTVEWRGARQDIRIELMAPDVTGADAERVHRGTALRIRSDGYDQLHAQRNPAAITVEQLPMSFSLGDGADGPSVLVPHPASFLLMKLFAFRDRHVSDKPQDKERAPYHAFDIFLLLSTLNLQEWEESLRILHDERVVDIVQQAREIVAEFFDAENAVGVLAMAVYAREREDMTLTREQRVAFAQDLRELTEPSR